MPKSRSSNDTTLLEADHKEGTMASYPALSLTQNNQKFYFVTIPAEDIFPYCYVSSREEDPIKGFQRTLNIERAMDISRYLDDSRGSIPTNIVLSAQKESLFTYNSKTKSVRYKRLPRAFLVLDGQHRLFGYGLAKKRHRVPVAIYEGLSRKVEATLFIDINTTQRGVPAALLLDIKQLAEKETVLESYLRKLFDKMNSDSKSPLFGLLSASKSATSKISRVTFNRAVAQLLRNPVTSQLSEASQYVLIRNYFRAVERSLVNTKLLRKKAYFEAFCEFFEEVARISRERFQNYKEESLAEVLAPLINIDLENLPAQGRSTITKHAVLDVLKDALSSQLDVNDDMI
jgi:DGQHR domain